MHQLDLTLYLDLADDQDPADITEAAREQLAPLLANWHEAAVHVVGVSPAKEMTAKEVREMEGQQ